MTIQERETSIRSSCLMLDPEVFIKASYEMQYKDGTPTGIAGDFLTISVEQFSNSGASTSGAIKFNMDSSLGGLEGWIKVDEMVRSVIRDHDERTEEVFAAERKEMEKSK